MRADGAGILGPGNGDQACGETGDGRMLEPAELRDELRRKAIMVDDFPKDFGRSELYQMTRAVTFEALTRRR